MQAQIDIVVEQLNVRNVEHLALTKEWRALQERIEAIYKQLQQQNNENDRIQIELKELLNTENELNQNNEMRTLRGELEQIKSYNVEFSSVEKLSTSGGNIMQYLKDISKNLNKKITNDIQKIDSEDEVILDCKLNQDIKKISWKVYEKMSSVIEVVMQKFDEMSKQYKEKSEANLNLENMTQIKLSQRSLGSKTIQQLPEISHNQNPDNISTQNPNKSRIISHNQNPDNISRN